MFEAKKCYDLLHKGALWYNGRNFILILHRKGRPNETCLIINNGWSLADPFSKAVDEDFPNAWVFGLYYKLSNPEKSAPKRHRVKKLLKKHPEFFGCEGLEKAQKELMEVLEQRLASQSVILVGFTKSATMMLNHAKYGSNVLVDAICPIFEGTLTTMPSVMRRYLRWIYPLVGKFLTEHIVDEDISVGSSYLEKADYSGVRPEQVSVVISSLDRKRVKHTAKEFWHPANFFFWLVCPIMEKAIRENQPDNTGYRSNAFLSYKTQLPTFAVSKIETVYASMPMTLNHPKVKELINKQIKLQNEKFQTKKNG